MKQTCTTTNSPISRCLTATAATAIALLLSATTGRADITLTNRLAVTPKHVFTLDDMGLPAQVEIIASSNDIPLAARADLKRPGAKVPADLLRLIGRGPQFAAPMRLEATIGTETIAARADAPATLQKTDKGVEATAKWKAGALPGQLSLLFTADGAVSGKITFDTKDTKLERLDLVMELSGPVDTAIAGDPAASAAGKILPPAFGALASESGMLWNNGATPAGDGAAYKGRVPHFFLGNGDRGFTWLAQGTEGYSIAGKESSMSVERKGAGTVIWRIALVNTPARGGEQTAGFTLLTHPGRDRSADRRRTQWEAWTGKAATPALDPTARAAASNTMVRADAGSVYEASAARTLLAGPAGGDALSAATTLSDRFPIALFRYLSGTHSALAVQLRTDAATLTTSGASPAPDRMAIGRALLHDAGVDVSSLANSVDAARVVQAMDFFGCFINDGQTEFLPYWRTAGILRYGEESQAATGFAVETEDPAARTHVSAFIRTDGPKRKALFVIVNEGTNAVRGQLYVQQPTYVFGGFNKLTVEHIYSQLDFSRIPSDSDWKRKQVEMTVPSLISPTIKTTLKKGMNPADVVPPLMDLETGGYVRLVEHGDPTKKFGPAYKVKEFFEVYGPVYVPARGMRILFGTGNDLNKLSSGISGRVLDAATGKPVVATIRIYAGSFRPAAAKADDDVKPAAEQTPATKVKTEKDGHFRIPVTSAGPHTVVAEIDGKLYPCSATPTAGDTNAGESSAWPAVTLSSGNWVDVTIEIGSASGS